MANIALFLPVRAQSFLMQYVDFTPVCSDDLILYTITSDATVRIFIPVLDSPYHLQLHTSLDVPLTAPAGKSSVTWIDGPLLAEQVKKSLSDQSSEMESRDSAALRRIEDLDREGWDLFLRTFADGSVEVTAVAVGGVLIVIHGHNIY